MVVLHTFSLLVLAFLCLEHKHGTPVLPDTILLGALDGTVSVMDRPHLVYGMGQQQPAYVRAALFVAFNKINYLSRIKCI